MRLPPAALLNRICQEPTTLVVAYCIEKIYKGFINPTKCCCLVEVPFHEYLLLHVA
jgi:hypothetical protein